jgi:uncharacterized tellurite resistance protein B-like protein
MFTDFITRLIGGGEEPLDEMDSQLALSALLVRVARTDGHYAADEIIRIDRILQNRFGLGPEAAKELRRRAEVAEGEAPDTVRFTRAIKDAVPYEDRVGVIEALWKVVLADGVRDPEEDALLRMSASLLGVSDPDSAMARQRAAGK